MSTLSFHELQQLTGYKRPADVERCLKRQGVPLFTGKDGPFTTQDALNQALGLRQDREPVERIEF